MTEILHWNLQYCLINFIFDKHRLLKTFTGNEELLKKGLNRRFFIMGWFNLFLFPFLFVFLVIYFLFRYGEELHDQPRTIGAREWSPYAWWRFREFNELPHDYLRRLKLAAAASQNYIKLFTVDYLTVVFAKFVTFIIGAFTVVLVILSLLDENVLIKLEITKNRTVLWYIGIFGGILAFSRNMIPDTMESDDSKNHEQVMEKVAAHTHYFPKAWRNKCHTKQVLGQFFEFFQLRIIIFLKEVFSVLFTPFILWFLMPKNTDKIIKFIQNSTKEIDGLGLVCTYALEEDSDPNETPQTPSQQLHPQPKQVQPTPDLLNINDDK